MLLQTTGFFLGIRDYLLPCFSKQLFGLDCPGCGLQRSIIFLLEGNFVEAFKMYPAIFTLIPFALLFVGSWFFKTKILGSWTTGFGLASAALILINFFIKLIH